MARKSRKNQEQNVTETPKTVAYAAWGYTRISNNGDRSEDSIESQRDIIEDYVSDKADIGLQNVIADLGFSGTDFLRPGYGELMAGIEKGLVQCVIVKDLSRVGRTYIEVGEVLFDTLPAYHVRFISVTDNYDSFADDAARKKLLILFKNLVNHMYSKDLGVKIRASRVLMQQRGEIIGCLPPYGYLFTKENGKRSLKVDPVASETVRLMFDMREQGYSLSKIANHLNDKGILSSRNHLYEIGYLTNEKDAERILWAGGGIGSILRNEVYIGNLVQNKTERRGRNVSYKPQKEWIVHENAHTAIIDKAQFDAVQKLLDEAGAIRKKKRTDELDENIYRGKLICARCGKAAARQFSHTRELGHRYRVLCRHCGRDIRQSQGLKKLPVFWLDQLEEIIADVLQKQIDACMEIGELVSAASKSKAILSKRQGLEAELAKLRGTSKKADEMLATAYTHHLAGILDSREFDLAREKFEKDKSMADARILLLAKEAEGYDIEKVQQNAFLTNFRKFNGFTKLDKEIVTALIQRIEITPQTNDVHIILNYMDEFKELNCFLAESGVLADVC